MEQKQTGAELIAQERERQIKQKGYSKENDFRYENAELFNAACCYQSAKRMRDLGNNAYDVPTGWPWRAEYWKPTPSDRIRECVKAGALFQADYDSRQEGLSLELRDLCAKEIDKLLKNN